VVVSVAHHEVNDKDPPTENVPGALYHPAFNNPLQVFKLDAEGSETIADLKQKISNTQGHSVESQKLIFSGTAYSHLTESQVFIRHHRQGSFR